MEIVQDLSASASQHSVGKFENLHKEYLHRDSNKTGSAISGHLLKTSNMSALTTKRKFKF